MSGSMLASKREGFALPMAILLIGFLTAGLMAAYTRQSSERSIVNSNGSQTNAFAVAEAGLENYIAAGSTTSTTATYTFSKGVATVVATQIKAAAVPTDTAIWLVRSTGVANGGTPTNPAARRTVAQIAYRVSPTLQVLSSWTSLSGIDKNGLSGNVSGTDRCGVNATLAGASVPTGLLTGKTEPFSGNPPISEMGTVAEAAAKVKIDWAGIVNTSGSSISPDLIYCYPGTSKYDVLRSPCSPFPAAGSFTSTYWPTILINGSGPLPGNGHGTLVVTGDLTLGGGDIWEGIILVGGTITDNGNGDIQGAVISGLNVKLGDAVPPSSKANGTKEYSYNSCSVANATNFMGKLSAMPNAWMDNWSAW
ncbi:MAG: hypothetical protein ABIV28_04590 [Longimicrobiales bacterium]